MTQRSVMMRCLILTGLVGMAPAWAAEVRSDGSPVVEQSMQAHGLTAWWGTQAVEATVTIELGGQTKVDRGRFYFEAHGPRARYEQGDTCVVYDGRTAWVWPAEAASPMLRFHVWTWPWFIHAPFKMNGDGITLSDEKTLTLQGQAYHTVLQTFGADQGDAPDDWYRLFIHPETKRLDAMSYIVTYGKTLEDANKTPSIILYDGYRDFDGVLLATEYTFWYLNEEGGLGGEAPKGLGRVTNISLYPQVDESRFDVPGDAVEVKLPEPAP